jgi:hypothetical protein
MDSPNRGFATVRSSGQNRTHFFSYFPKKSKTFYDGFFSLRCAANLEEDSSCARSLEFDRAWVAHRQHISFKSKTGSFIFTVTSARTFGTKTQAMG